MYNEKLVVEAISEKNYRRNQSLFLFFVKKRGARKLRVLLENRGILMATVNSFFFTFASRKSRSNTAFNL